jgi:hypothetical protein
MQKNSNKHTQNILFILFSAFLCQQKGLAGEYLLLPVKALSFPIFLQIF